MTTKRRNHRTMQIVGLKNIVGLGLAAAIALPLVPVRLNAQQALLPCPADCNKCLDGACIPNRLTYGFYQPKWRRWPGSTAPTPELVPTPPTSPADVEALPRVPATRRPATGRQTRPEEATTSPDNDVSPMPSGGSPIPDMPGTTAPGSTSPGSVLPGTVFPGTESPGTGASGTETPSTSSPGLPDELFEDTEPTSPTLDQGVESILDGNDPLARLSLAELAPKGASAERRR